MLERIGLPPPSTARDIEPIIIVILNAFTMIEVILLILYLLIRRETARQDAFNRGLGLEYKNIK